MANKILTTEEAKQIWKQTNPEYWTYMHATEKENNHLRALGHAHWCGFKMALQLTGQMEVK